MKDKHGIPLTPPDKRGPGEGPHYQRELPKVSANGRVLVIDGSTYSQVMAYYKTNKIPVWTK